MEQDTDIYPDQGAVGGIYQNHVTVTDDVIMEDIAVHTPVPGDHMTEPLGASVRMVQSELISSVNMKKSPLGQVEAPCYGNDLQDEVVNLKQSKRMTQSGKKKVCHRGNQLHRKVVPSEEFTQPANRQPNSEILEQFISEINLNVKKDVCKPQSVRGLILNEKYFSGDFKPEKSQSTKGVGSGTNGEVTIFQDPKTNKSLAKKTMNLRGPKGIKLKPNEIKVPLEFDSPNLAKVVGLGHDANKVFVIMEDAGLSLRQWVSKPHLWNHLKNPGVMESVAMDILSGLSDMASKGFAHRDLKPENVCIQYSPDRPSEVTATLIDFASSQKPCDKPSLSDISPEYLDPGFNTFYMKAVELKRWPPNPRLIEPKDDVWAFGMLLLFVKYGGHPMIRHHLGLPEYPHASGDDATNLRFQVLGKISEMKCLPKEFYEYPESPALQKVLREALKMNRDDRPSAAELKQYLAELLKPRRKRARSTMEVDEQMPTSDKMAETGGQGLRLKSTAVKNIATVMTEGGDYENKLVDKKQRREQQSSLTAGAHSRVEQMETTHYSMPGIENMNLTENEGQGQDRMKMKVDHIPTDFGVMHHVPRKVMQPEVIGPKVFTVPQKKLHVMPSHVNTADTGDVEMANGTPSPTNATSFGGVSMHHDNLSAPPQHDTQEEVVLHSSRYHRKVEGEIEERGSYEELVQYFKEMDNVGSVSKPQTNPCQQKIVIPQLKQTRRQPVDLSKEAPVQLSPETVQQLMMALKKQEQTSRKPGVTSKVVQLSPDVAKKLLMGQNKKSQHPMMPNQGSTIVQPQGSTFAQPQGSTFAQPQGSTFAQPQGSTFARPQGSTFAQPRSHNHGQQESGPLGNGQVREQGMFSGQPIGDRIQSGVFHFGQSQQNWTTFNPQCIPRSSQLAGAELDTGQQHNMPNLDILF